MQLNKKITLLSVFWLCLFIDGCAPLIVISPPNPQEPQKQYSINIPKGHFPPPGHCRIWYPDREPGQQPPPQRCPIPLSSVPLGAYVVSRSDGDNNQVVVDIYHQQKPGVVVDTRYLSIK